MYEELVSQLGDAAEAFVGPLRLNDGFDQLALDELCRQIDQFGNQWRTSEVVPKSVALLLSELYPAICACADLYSGSERQRMIEAAVRVGERVTYALDPAGEPEM
ncbi:hypothetical protein [Streptomyces griseorubiginosus]|uniref:hypothetical protein n=1 Tax=Streptomyces griseorubiginosus TaxID=67304 RepID=UPI001AD65437|nr:hypothetical protein [Streptomyces griseorubiginosus]MBO4254186.1 hypothetical protein [Streptomyces griseorubiginosus]